MNKFFFTSLLALFLWACDSSPKQEQETASQADPVAQADPAAPASRPQAAPPPAHHHKGGGDHDANSHMNKRSFEELVAAFEDPERHTWQMPVEVIAQLGLVREKTVIDIGCGTGYFAFPLAAAGANVICADVDDRFQQYVREKKKGKVENGDKIELRKLAFDDPGLEPEEVDMALVVNTYHHIQDREDYFARVKKGLKVDGQLVIIDFVKYETPVGPPVEMRMSEEEVLSELRMSGFEDFDVRSGMLPFQYVIIAKN